MKHPYQPADLPAKNWRETNYKREILAYPLRLS